MDKISSQCLASDPLVSVWVAASAGTGKTKILTDRVLRLLMLDNHPSKILCITFTKAAAAEMSHRINEELASWSIISEDELSRKLFELTKTKPKKACILKARRLFTLVLDASDGIKILTIHSFCQNLLKKFPIESGIAINSKIIDETYSRALLQEAKMRVLESENLKESSEYLSWHLYEASYEELILQIIENRIELERIFSYHRYDWGSIEREILLKFNFINKISKEELLNGFHSRIERNISSLRSLSKVISPKQSYILEKWLSHFDNREFCVFYDIFVTKDKKIRKIINENKYKDFPEIFSEIRDWQNLCLDLGDKINSLKIIELTHHFFCLASLFIKTYNELKLQHSVLDYNDLITISKNLLSDTYSSQWILYKLDGGIQHILVDEAQDTSKEQWQIISSLCEDFFVGEGSDSNNRTIFVVGDEKQSIFSFQGANPLYFHKMQDYFSKIIQDSTREYRSIKLDISYRSTKSVLKIVDAIFNKKEYKSAVSNSDLEVILHKPSRVNAGGRVELWPLVEVSSQQNKDTWIMPNEAQIKNSSESKLAQLIASKISEWINGGKILKSSNRRITEKDIIILIRRRNDLGQYLVKELKKRSIQVAGIDRIKISENIAIMDLIALAKFLLLNEDDLSLACLLKSPLFCLTEEMIMALSIGREESLWSRLRLLSSEHKLYQEAYCDLEYLIKISKFSTPFELFNHVVDVRGGRKKFLSRMGEEVNDPIDEFLNLALEFQKNYPPSLEEFVKWFENNKEVEIKRDFQSNKNAVRIMTVHASKGLQAKIVILADTISLPVSMSHFIFEENIVIWPYKISNYNEYCNQLRQRECKKDYQEYLRLLYVALTRAEDELIICGHKGSQKIPENCWYKIIKNTIEDLGVSDIFEVQSAFLDCLESRNYMFLENPQIIAAPSQEINDRIIKKEILPDFLLSKPLSNEALLKTITPSAKNANISQYNSLILDKKQIIKGDIVHKILEYLHAAKDPVEYIESFLLKHASSLSKYEMDLVKNQCVNLVSMKEYRLLFDKNSKTEISVSGIINNKYKVSGKIDKLVMLENRVIIVDYKTDINPVESEERINVHYLRQMSAYKALISEIYPDKVISCWILWTSNATISKLSDQILDQNSPIEIVN